METAIPTYEKVIACKKITDVELIKKCVMCNIVLERDKDGILLCVMEYNGNDGKCFCKKCYFTK